MNESGLFDPPLPSLHPDDAFVYSKHDKQNYVKEWVQAFLHVATGGAHIEYRDTLPYRMDDTHWLCFKRAVFTGTIPGVVPDVETGARFRADMYRHMGIELPSTPVNRVLFWFRPLPLYRRSILNTNELLAIADAHGINYTYLDDNTMPQSFREQLQLFASHGVLVAPHGAGLMNEMFMAPGSAVIEIFPYHFHHNLYAILAGNVGVTHYPVHTWNGSYMWARSEVRDD